MKIEIESLARVEGHGGILVELEGKKVKNVQFNIFEGPRLIETLTIGKTPAENISLVCRICAICTISHRYASIRALERALAIKVPPKTQLTRTLMHLGEMMESHSLHVFLLSLPDLVNRSSAIDMIDQYAAEVTMALRMKKFGNLVMATTTDRMIHGENAILGGFGSYPSRQQLVDIKNEAQNLLPHAIKAVDLLASFSLPTFFEKETIFMALEPGNDKFGFVGDTVIVSSGENRSIEDYKSLTNERVVPHSFSKRSLYQGEPFTVGALARINLIGERLQGEAGKCFEKHYQPRWKKNPLFNIMAQVLELVYCMEEIPGLVDKIIQLEDAPVISPSRPDGEATGAVEAPRGILYHHYRVEDGLIAGTDIITPTAQNLDDVEKYFRLAAENQPSGSEHDIGHVLETIARAYDPCISCSAHLVEIKRAETDEKAIEWKTALSSLLRDSRHPVFVGLGNIDRSDDGVGIVIAQRLRALGHERVLVEDEWERLADRTNQHGGSTIIFIDAADFGAAPGEIGVFPLHSSRSSHATTHRAVLDFCKLVSEGDGRSHHLLAVQPSSTEFARKVSPPVLDAAEEVVEFVTHLL